MEPLHERIRAHWNPQPIEPPKVDPDLPKLTGLQRATESLRYSLLSLEWWLSPNGKLREWLRFNGKISSILLIPAVLVMPLITLVVWQVATWVIYLVQIASNLIILPLAAIAAAILIGGVVLLTRALLGR